MYIVVYFQCGVIECVPDSKSRDQIGKATDISLDQYFIQKYGDQDTPSFQDVSSSPSQTIPPVLYSRSLQKKLIHLSTECLYLSFCDSMSVGIFISMI
jgi:hypothetical protein